MTTRGRRHRSSSGWPPEMTKGSSAVPPDLAALDCPLDKCMSRGADEDRQMRPGRDLSRRWRHLAALSVGAVVALVFPGLRLPVAGGVVPASASASVVAPAALTGPAAGSLGSGLLDLFYRNSSDGQARTSVVRARAAGYAGQQRNRWAEHSPHSPLSPHGQPGATTCSSAAPTMPCGTSGTAAHGRAGSRSAG